ncbi:MAG TPA: DUF6318 family protein, partial [Aeromicrobium sp.]|nr:DUF6318 family protein [Aeromicrobium sp.]
MRRLALACAALIVLSGCGRAPTPIEPSATASDPGRSPEPTSSLKPPTLPAAAKRNDETGAANFVAYWVKLANYASQTGDTEQLRRISSPSCAACDDYIHLYEETYADGGYIKGGLDKLSAVEVERGSDEQFVRARVTSSPGTFKASK